MTKITTVSSLEELNSEITQNFSKLSKRLQQVAEYVLENPNGIAFGTVVMIAKDATVHPSTLIRFANAFGFTGFSDMQKLFQKKLLQESSSYEDRIKLVQDDANLDQKNATSKLLDQFSQANSHALNYLKDNINADDLEQARMILSKADTIHVKAVRRSFPIASYLAYLLNHINVRCYLLDGVGGMHKEQEHLIRKNDAVIVISFHPYASETQSTVDAAIAKGTPIILFTDSPLSPLKEHATVCFTVKEAEVYSFRSLTATMCLVQSLAISLAH
ncbi:MurR/RpiR family transcriptional regulator [Aliiglaciecola lipolytica]|uniref:Transcriptional regulator, RpiR family n=1 Tax=Aliiglaciecola lipolytica E3 TaxID=1127673 RepID=K6WZS3_9ALTE|nr:MurR/RpiR family transcriptional regulator [Aliiglaciecola lipolytica]GAC13919.1 transcriptional regulator, RpiR family [Aliiglaciecola lipolytica E3]